MVILCDTKSDVSSPSVPLEAINTEAGIVSMPKVNVAVLVGFALNPAAVARAIKDCMIVASYSRKSLQGLFSVYQNNPAIFPSDC
jgi:hypothetical protein